MEGLADNTARGIIRLVLNTVACMDLQKAKPRLGLQIFRRDPIDGKKIEAGLITNPSPVLPPAERDKPQGKVNLIIFKDGSGYIEPLKQVKQGLKPGEWWHSLDELEAQIAYEQSAAIAGSVS